MQGSSLRVDIRAEIDHERWWRMEWMLYRWAMKAARPRGLPLLRVAM